jgi:hypothetical protein
MLKINNKQFDIYDIDTNENILNRIAINMNTLTKYLYS